MTKRTGFSVARLDMAVAFCFRLLYIPGVNDVSTTHKRTARRNPFPRCPLTSDRASRVLFSSSEVLGFGKSSPAGPHATCRSHIPLATLCDRDSRRPAKAKPKIPSRGIENLVMASIAGAPSPPSHSDSTNASTTLSGKRKRDDTIEVQSHINGITESKNNQTGEDPQAVIRDFVDVLKA